MIVDGIHRRRKFPGAASDHGQELQLCGSEQASRFHIGISSENARPDDYVRLVELRRWLEIAPVKMERDFEIVGRKMRGESERQTQLGREPRAEIARPEQIQRDAQSGARNCLNSGVRTGEIRLKLDQA